jgi:hypothetical protein
MKKLVYEISIDEGNSVKTLNSLESELSEINKELKDTAVNSDAFNKLASQAKLLEGEIQGINNSVKGLNLEDKIKAGDASMKILAGSTQTLVGSLGLLGVESEQLGKFEEKAASSIALGMGIKDLSKGIGDLSNVMAKLPGPTKIATAAQRVFNTVLKANPVGLIITAITIVVGLFLVFNKRIREVISTFEPLNKIIEGAVGLFRKLGQALGFVASDAELLAQKQRDLAKATADTLSDTLRIQRALGEDTVELERKILNERINATEEFSDERKKALTDLYVFEAELIKKSRDEEKKRFAESERVRKENEEKAASAAKARAEERVRVLDEIAKASVSNEQEQLQFNLDEVNKYYNQLIKDAKKFGQDTTQLEEARLIKINLLNKEYADKLREIDEARLSGIEDISREALKLEQEFILKGDDLIKSQRQSQLLAVQEQYDELIRRAQQFGVDSSNIEIERLIAIETLQDEFRKQDAEKKKEQQELEVEKAQEISDILFGIDKARVEMLDATTLQARQERLRIQLEEVDRERIIQEARLKELGATELEISNLKQFYADKSVEIQANAAEQELAIQQAKQDAIASATAGLFGALSGLLGENSKIGKKFAVGDAIIQTYLGVAKALGSAPPPINFITAASVAASGIANVRKILSTNPGNASTPTAPTFPTSGINPASFATVQTPGVPNFGDLGNISSTGFGTSQRQEPVRAYVVTGDVRTGLEAENKIRTRRTVGKPE